MSLNPEQFRYNFAEGDLVYKGVHLRQTQGKSPGGRRYDKTTSPKYMVHLDPNDKQTTIPQTLARTKKEVNDLMSRGFIAHPQGYLHKEEK